MQVTPDSRADLRPFTPATLAKRWACSERHVRNLIARGQLPCFRIGTLLRIRAEDVEAFERGEPAQPRADGLPAADPRPMRLGDVEC